MNFRSPADPCPAGPLAGPEHPGLRGSSSPRPRTDPAHHHQGSL